MSDVFEPSAKLARDDPRLGVRVDLTITYHPNGSLSVTGPVGDKVLCHWLLDQARDAIRRQRTSLIHPIPPEDAPLPPGTFL